MIRVLKICLMMTTTWINNNAKIAKNFNPYSIKNVSFQSTYRGQIIHDLASIQYRAASSKKSLIFPR